MKDGVKKELTTACADGTLCVKVKFVVPEENDENCSVAGADPSSTVRRNSELTVTIACSFKEEGDDPPSTPSSDTTTTTTTTSS